MLIRIGIYNGNAAALTTNIYASPDAAVTQYFINSSVALGTLAGSSINPQGYMWLPGDSLILNNSVQPAHYNIAGYLFDNTGPLQPISYRGLISGNNTIFTNPALTRTSFIGIPPTLNSNFSSLIFANHGAATVYSQSIVTGGNTIGIGKATNTNTATGSSIAGIQSDIWLNPGDTIIVNLSVAIGTLSHCWVPSCQLPSTVITATPPSAEKQDREGMDLMVGIQRSLRSDLKSIRPITTPATLESKEEKRGPQSAEKQDQEGMDLMVGIQRSRRQEGTLRATESKRPTSAGKKTGAVLVKSPRITKPGSPSDEWNLL